MNDDFVFVDELVPGIRWDAKYATWDNFVGRPIDGYLANRVVASRELGLAIGRVQAEAASLGFGLLLWDAYRPQRAVDCFAAWAEQPEDHRTKLRHYPRLAKADLFASGYIATRSAHTRGGAVDLTLYHLATGDLVDMGGGYDFMDAISQHGSRAIGRAAGRNRQRLRSLMEAGGFDAYDPEWWHYTLRDEPYPDTYFDFPITPSPCWETDVHALLSV